jgi:outer membrane protein assembly complex protein YaeT
VSSAVILNLVRSKEGERFDPATVEEDYKRIYQELKRFSNVEARVEQTASGVIVVFAVTEQRQIREIRYQGNKKMRTSDLQALVDLEVGQAIDQFRISLAKQAIEGHYQEKNYPFAHVEVPTEDLGQKGVVVFNVVEGPEVRIRKVAFKGNRSFTDERLKGVVETKFWIWIFRSGKFDADQLDDDVAAVRHYYESKGFFDARVGRRLSFSADQEEMEVTFVIDEGVRYRVQSVSFKGNAHVADASLRSKLKLVEGENYDQELLGRDVKAIVTAYSPFGFIYEQVDGPGGAPNPDYLRITPKRLFRREAGKVDLIYDISEGKPFHLGRAIVKGNSKTQEKVVLRELRTQAGELYNSGELLAATDRLRGTPYFSSASITPVGDDAEFRDIVVEVEERRTATILFGAGVNSNGGVAGNITYEQSNFDIGNWPESARDILSDRAFVGAGQNFRASFEPGTQQTNASVRFYEPWLLDQPYSFSSEGYLRNYRRRNYEDQRI